MLVIPYGAGALNCTRRRRIVVLLGPALRFLVGPPPEGGKRGNEGEADKKNRKKDEQGGSLRGLGLTLGLEPFALLDAHSADGPLGAKVALPVLLVALLG